ncbi:riboflavin biosynthesis protein RibF [Bacteroides helcogenes]|uniref:Riboflavin biosynthesis protein n=1 Tax=Bacteroides helcogenes (strain ATCC 35417 / DSM 20613 / JCM 6297 / CCUG 15421 / P 36-108) TaxID=693979 RepID=E6SQL0_BACT6|nr:riboflavin biosynthesis protein RibF [Bacteroides helcogenes]ADV42984.1 riboflavin kinase; FMN adenylyltransferase [Bacteroides helcogenes P 36-108]MDY5236973.1 riboflavin biosynthesis protein RibF [Bacteroides helcogenes]
MRLVCETSDIVLRPSIATIGFFDGVHRGHRYLIEQVCEVAAMRGLASAVITFPIHPRQVMCSDYHPALLTTCDEKISLLAETGIDYCMMLDFTPEVARLSARQFMAVLKERYLIEVLVIGYDHRFGHNRSEGFDDYVRYGKELGIEVLLAHAYYYNKEKTGSTVSSSLIRHLLLKGNVSAAAEYLGYGFFLGGTVVGGYQVGRKIGFPTANLRVDSPDKIIPSDGVYAVYVSLDGMRYGGMLSIGYRPTLANGTDRSIEVNIFHFDADIYDRPMQVSFVRYMRPEQKFNTVEELIARIRRDEEEINSVLSMSTSSIRQER